MDVVDVCNGEENIQIHFENFVDSEPFPSIKYTPFNVTGPGCQHDPCEVLYSGCQCHQTLCDKGCPCITRSLGLSYDSNGCLLSGCHSGNKPVLECNSSCMCSQACQNRVVQNGINFRLEVFRSDKKGWGLKALENIPKDRFVCEYAGEIIGFEEANKRALNMSVEDSNYILILKEHLKDGKTLRTCVDPANIGNIGRFINHSCDPNLYMTAVRVDNEVPKLALFAKREIFWGEELSFDYAGDPNEGVTDQENSFVNSPHCQYEGGKSLKSVRIFDKPCFCNASNCRGFLPFDEDLYSELAEFENQS
ncbi:histone-lysine N-methyltransferase SETMAR-like [Ptychodera flava]|uniref:histone-lysine N-methyltransferase SETMAR-like n=1 Tax=Ptychodera flava TaxID=63121 RepID=UPI003969CF24